MNVPASPKTTPAVGYLAISHDPQHGFLGGLLIVSPQGRPLEFHCSTPVLPTRAQEILYGPTLRPYVSGELIAGALLAAVKIRPRVLLVQDLCGQPPAAGCPVGVIPEGYGVQPDEPANEQSPLAAKAPPIILSGGPEADLPEAEGLLAELSERINLAEPFERVHEAIREAQRIGAQEVTVDDAA
ncbi:MAG: hypothetical protein KDA37_16825 [Planctomycetales bacterium]|nr:hypothetical protein [Planctomycetales bacterium]